MNAAPSGWSVAAVVPARNEAARIERCLDSVLRACERCAAARFSVSMSAT